MNIRKWLDNAGVALRLVLDNAFLVPEEEFAKMVTSIFERSKLMDLFSSPKDVNRESLASRIRLINRLQKSSFSPSLPNSKSDVIKDTGLPKVLVEILELASSLGYHAAVASVIQQKPEVLIYVGGAGSEGSITAEAHASVLERFCGAQCLQFSPFLQSVDWTDEQASIEFEYWRDSLSKSKEVVCVIGHSAGCETIARNLPQLPVPLIFLATDLIGTSKIEGVKMLLPSNEIKEGSIRWGNTNELHFLPESSHSLNDAKALIKLQEILEELVGVR